MSLNQFAHHPFTTPVAAGLTVPEIGLGIAAVYAGVELFKGAVGGARDLTRNYIGGLLGTR